MANKKTGDVPFVPEEKPGAHGNLGPGTGASFQGTGAPHGAQGIGPETPDLDHAADVLSDRERSKATPDPTTGGLGAVRPTPGPGGSTRDAPQRAARAIDANRGRIADRIQGVSARLSERAQAMEQRGGFQSQAASYIRRGTGAMDNTAHYIRDRELTGVREDLESQIKRSPLLAVGLALGAGFVMGRLMRDR